MKKKINAALNGYGTNEKFAYFFKADQYIKYDWNADKPVEGYPQSISNWKLPGSFQSSIDAACNGGATHEGKAYFFKGAEYVRFDWNNDAPDEGYPQPLAAWNFPGDFSNGIDAVLEGVNENSHKRYFFKTNQYLRYDLVNDTIDEGYPLNIELWGLKEDFLQGVDAVLNGKGAFESKAYFFKDNRYMRYDWSTDACDTDILDTASWNVNFTTTNEVVPTPNTETTTETNVTEVPVSNISIANDDSLEGKIRRQINSVSLTDSMQSAAEHTMTNLQQASGSLSALDVLKKNIVDTSIPNSKAAWCGFTAWYAYQHSNMNRTLQQFFEGVGGVNCFVNYKDDRQNDLTFKIGQKGTPLNLKDFHTALGILRVSYTVEDVINGTQTPQAGDIVLVDNGGDPAANHIQMVYRYDATSNADSKKLVVIEGNAQSFIHRNSNVLTDDKIARTPIRNDGLSRWNRLEIVRTVLGDTQINGKFAWNDPGINGNITTVGVSAYDLVKHQQQPRDANAPLKIVKFVRPSAMDFIDKADDNIIYKSPYYN
jgi:hypothetical protein